MGVRFALSEKGATNAKREKSRMNSMVLGWNQRCWYEFLVIAMQIVKYISIYQYKQKCSYKCYTHTHTFSFTPLISRTWEQRHFSNWHSQVAQILVSKSHSPLKGTRLLGDLVDYRKEQDERGTSCVRKLESAYKQWGQARGQRNQPEGTPIGQIWDNFSIKTNNDRNKPKPLK